MNLTLNVQHFSLEVPHDLSSLSIYMEVDCNRVSFSYPFMHMDLQISEDLESTLKLQIANERGMLATSLLPLEELAIADYIERWVVLYPISEGELSPEKSPSNRSSKKKSIGKMKVSAKLEKPAKKPHTVKECEKCKNLRGSTQITKSSQNFFLEILKQLSPQEHFPEKLNIQEMSLDIKKLAFGEGDITGYKAAHMRSLLLGLNEKLNSFASLQIKLKEAEEFSKQCQNAREKMQLKLDSSCTKIEKLKAQNYSMFSEFKKEKQESDQVVERVKSQLRSTQKELASVKSENEQVRSEANELQVQLENQEKMNQMIQSLQTQLQQETQAKNTLRSNMETAIEQFTLAKEKFQKDLQQILNDNQQLTLQLETSENQNKGQQNQINTLKSKVLSLEAQVSDKDSQIAALAKTQQRNLELRELCEARESEISKLNLEIQEISSNFSNQIKKFENEKNSLFSKIKEVQAEKFQLEDDSAQKTTQIKQLNNQKQNLSAQIKELEQQICLQQDNLTVKEDLSSLFQNNEKLQNQTYKDLDSLSQYCLKQAEQSFNNQKYINQLNDFIAEKDHEVQILREMVSELQKLRDSYVPVKDDPVDQAIAEYVNTHRVDVPFVREDPGIYLFGTKRVFIKLENGKIIVRVGGGYMSIDEFVDVYSPLELEKHENKKKMVADAKRASILGKLGASAVERSAEGRRSEVSPQRATKIIKDAFSGGNSNFSTFYAVVKRSPSRKGSSPSKKPQSPYHRPQYSNRDS